MEAFANRLFRLSESIKTMKFSSKMEEEQLPEKKEMGYFRSRMSNLDNLSQKYEDPLENIMSLDQVCNFENSQWKNANELKEKCTSEIESVRECLQKLESESKRRANRTEDEIDLNELRFHSKVS